MNASPQVQKVILSIAWILFVTAFFLPTFSLFEGGRTKEGVEIPSPGWETAWMTLWVVFDFTQETSFLPRTYGVLMSLANLFMFLTLIPSTWKKIVFREKFAFWFALPALSSLIPLFWFGPSHLHLGYYIWAVSILIAFGCEVSKQCKEAKENCPTDAIGDDGV